MRKWLVLLAAILCFLFSAGYAAADQNNGSVVVVVMDRLNINDINSDDLPGFKKLMTEGSVGLLNTNTAASVSSQHTYATIGAGAPAVGLNNANMAFNANTRLEDGLAKDIFHRRTGKMPPDEGVLQLSIAQLDMVNKNQFRSVQIGALGTALHQAGFKTAVFGNTDVGTDLGRQAVTIAMDENGIVDYGHVGSEVLLNDPLFPGGKRTDYDKLLNYVNSSLADYQLVVVELGDTARLHAQKDKLFPNIYKDNLQQTLQRSDTFLSKLAADLGEKDLLIVVSPTPNKPMLQENRKLTPIIVWGKEFNQAGAEGNLLISGTTKHPGIVSNTDIAPTILNHFGIDYGTLFSGRPMFVQSIAGDAGDFLQKKLDRLVVTYNARAPLQQGYVLFQLIIIAVALWSIFISKKGTKLLKPAILMVVSVPLAYLLMPLIPQPSVPLVGIELIVFTLAIATAANILGRKSFICSFTLLAVLTVTVLLLDIALGQPLQKQAILSYDPMVGARFYGIGNEYMGVFIGATIMAASLIINSSTKYRKAIIAAAGLWFAVSIYFMAAPNLGTNVGGTIAAAASFLITFLLFLNIKIRPKVIIAVAAAVLTILLAFIAFDLTRPVQQQSHIGQTARLIINGGFIEIYNVINRKLGMNIKLLRYTVWSRVLLASIVALAILYHKPRGVMQQIKDKYPYIFKGFIGVVAGALVAFVFNDSGVVAAATTMIFGAPPLIYLVLKEQTNGGVKNCA